MPRHIAWHEIASICPADPDRSHVIDLYLRWPRTTLTEAQWPARMGAYCQHRFGVPAVTISMLLLEGDVAELLDAVAQHRPDLLHNANRREYRHPRE